MLRTWIVYTVAMLATTFVVPGFKLRGLWDAVIVAAIFGVLNVLIGWFIAGVIVVGTLGLGWLFWFITRWVTNAVLLEATQVVSGRVQIKNFGTALAASAVMSLAGTFVEWMIRR